MEKTPNQHLAAALYTGAFVAASADSYLSFENGDKIASAGLGVAGVLFLGNSLLSFYNTFEHHSQTNTAELHPNQNS